VSAHSLAGIFSYRDRIGRKRYWLGLAVVAVVGFAMLYAAGPYFSAVGGRTRDIVFFFLLSVIMIARLHDRNMSGWWFTLFGPLPVMSFYLSFNVYRTFPASHQGQRMAEPFVLALQLGAIGLFLWGVISLGLKQGTPGDNKFGSNPQ
jgi:uncharacterized membrane protein YhaH (DUF805 family)